MYQEEEEEEESSTNKKLQIIFTFNDLFSMVFNVFYKYENDDDDDFFAEKKEAWQKNILFFIYIDTIQTIYAL